MQGQIALVTGGMGGIGTAICQNFHNNGAIVISTYHQGGNHETAQAWQQNQKKLGYDFDIIYVNVTEYESCASMIRTVEKKYGRIDILVNNAGITRDAQLSKMNLEQWREVLQTNLDGLFNITRNVITGMIERQFGRIINVSSVNGQKGQFGQANYSAAKAGIHGFTKTLAQEVARKCITVNTISPGYIGTNMVLSMPQEAQEKIMSQIPVGRFGKPEEIASAISFLAAKQSGFITGANIHINGGHHMM